MFLLFVCVALRGQQSKEKQQMRIQEGHFLKSVLNLVLIADSESTQKKRADSHQNHRFPSILLRVMAETRFA